MRTFHMLALLCAFLGGALAHDVLVGRARADVGTIDRQLVERIVSSLDKIGDHVQSSGESNRRALERIADKLEHR